MNKHFLSVDDVARICDVSKSKAYSIIQKINRDLQDEGCIVIAGKVSKKYFYSKLAIEEVQ